MLEEWSSRHVFLEQLQIQYIHTPIMNLGSYIETYNTLRKEGFLHY